MRASLPADMVSMIDIMISSTQVEEVLVEQAHGFLEGQQQMYVASLEDAGPSAPSASGFAVAGDLHMGAAVYGSAPIGGACGTGFEQTGLVEVVVDPGSAMGCPGTAAAAACDAPASCSATPGSSAEYNGYAGFDVEGGMYGYGSFQEGYQGYGGIGGVVPGGVGGEQPVVGVQVGGGDGGGEVRWLAPELNLLGLASGSMAAEVGGVGAGGQQSGVYGSSSSCYIEEQV